MFTQSSTEGVKPSAPMKRSIFNKPSWSNPQPIADTDEFFHRSNQTYVERAAEAERKRKRKLARKQREHAQDEPTSERAGKRRRVSDDSDDDGNSSSSDEDPTQNEKETYPNLSEDALDSKVPLSNPTELKAFPKTLSERYEDTMAAHKPDEKQTALPSNIIDLEEDSEDSEAQENSDDCEITATKISKPPEEDEFTTSDEEFPELARKARGKARRKRLESDITFANLDSPLIAVDHESLQRAESIPQPTPVTPPEAVIQILITSRIDYTNPLIVSRRASQRLKDVRLAWCQRQGFTPEFIATVFLTWRGKRLFDVTTCKSLGIAVDQYGNILLKGEKDIMGEEDRQIHMEAMTDEILEEYKKAKRRVIIDEEEENDEAMAATTTDIPPGEQDKESQVRIILKAKGFEDFKLIVKPVNCAGNLVDNLYQSADVSSQFLYPRSSVHSGRRRK